MFYQCTSCKLIYDHTECIWKCPKCSGLLDLQFTFEIDIAKLRNRKCTLWRYREAIPIESDNDIISFDEGMTPLQQIVVNDYPVQLKLDFLFPSGSYKDRGSTVLISKAKSLRVNEVVEDSSGNAGASIAAYCAKANIASNIYVSNKSSKGKLFQIQSYGASLHTIEGSREDVAQAAKDAANRLFYASHVYHPFFYHGTKTFAYEVCEQLGWKVPDTIVLPMGNGTIFIGAYIGFSELVQLNIIEKIPKFIGIQTKACAPIYKTYVNQSDCLQDIIPNQTVAEGIAIAKSARWKQMIDIVQFTKGQILAVDEIQIKSALIDLSHRGYYVEPTAAAAFAGVTQYIQNLESDELIVSTLTGHGLKTGELIDIMNC